MCWVRTVGENGSVDQLQTCPSDSQFCVTMSSSLIEMYACHTPFAEQNQLAPPCESSPQGSGFEAFELEFAYQCCTQSGCNAPPPPSTQPPSSGALACYQFDEQCDKFSASCVPAVRECGPSAEFCVQMEYTGTSQFPNDALYECYDPVSAEVCFLVQSCLF